KSVATMPRVAVDVDGGALAAGAARCLEAVRVQQRLSVPTLCELSFFDLSGQAAGGADLPAPGQSLRVVVDGNPVPLFEGEVTAVERIYGPGNGREVRVRAYDELHRLRKSQQVKAHESISAMSLARELAPGLGLRVDGPPPGPTWPRLIQHRQSDLELLASLAERSGLYVTVRDGALHLITLEGVGDPAQLGLGDTLLEARVETNGDPACRSVSAAGWDPLQAKVHEGRASTPSVGREVAAEVPPDLVGGTGEIALLNESAPDEAQAQAIAQIELDWRVAREVVLWGVAQGDPELRPGTPVEVSGLQAELAGRYVLTAVTHTVDIRTGFVSEISTEPPAMVPRDRGAGIALGEVTSVDDPDGLGRVKAKLPAFGGVETAWMGVLTAGAGRNKGLIAMPDVGDQVLVLLAHDDPGEGMVLGGLYGMQAPPDPGMSGGAIRRYTFLTPGGQRVTLDDGKTSIRLEDATGSYLELSPKQVTVHAAVDLTLDAPGRAVIVRGKSVDFETA
ncbi:MAG TPA: phage baseplate assembly protein V, partial [Actinomycetota bacterium]|nr:phage baseplate assembly protein V [Actinomycetota bacterium]